MRPLLATAAVVLALAALVTTAPALVGLSTTAVVAHAVALRGASALGLLVLAAMAAVAALRRRGRDRPAAVVAGGLAVVLLACAAVHVGVVLARGLEDQPPGAGADLVVVTLNAEVDGVTPAQLADLVESSGADVVALPETSLELATAMAREVEERTGVAFAVFGEAVDERPIAATSLLVSARRGEHERVPAPELDLSAVAARPVDGDGPLLVAVHPPPPIPGSFSMDRWAAQAATAASVCAAVPGAVVAGDLNATLDHAPLRDLGPCADAAASTGAAGLGTWPASAPALLGSPIDHVLVDARAWEPLTTQAVRVGDTDHRALVVGLAAR
ncbi:endonuclease/exonuclease/phosphatase family protein [uncultured Pseudokineococcus sp.]|uniref:endonuclease/exonuclease/phosphatase family protein n=1 Tax=uncultured Pseudokineococcus sp. TaxID=1642928 RepID=UPI00262B948C|nr:endonuclease/exonuclease/phosphatase family protein [uncultured Pseudokineococcus sp.]